MPGKHAYRFLPFTHKQCAMEEKPPVELVNLPRRSPSRIASDVVENSIYKHRKVEKTRKQRRMRLMVLGAAVSVGLVLLVVVVAVAVVLSRGGPGMELLPLELAIVPSIATSPEGRTLLRYNVSDSETYQPYVAALNDFLDDYEKASHVMPGYSACGPSTTPILTSSTRPMTADSNDTTSPTSPVTNNASAIVDQTVLRDPECPIPFPLYLLGDECSSNNSYGYPSGSPCVLLVLRAAPQWDPSSCTESATASEVITPVALEQGDMDNASVSTNQTTSTSDKQTTTTTATNPPTPEVPATLPPPFISGENTSEYVPIACYSDDGKIVPEQAQLFPSFGFAVSSLGGRGRARYNHPLVMLRLVNVSSHVNIDIICAACGRARAGGDNVVRFRLRID